MQKLQTYLRMENRPIIERMISSIIRFIHQETAGGVVLLIAAVAALILSNSPFSYQFLHFWETHFIIGTRDFNIDKTIHFWISDTLMAIFFFVVGLEIKRSLVLGELSTVRRAALPIVAAVGGMVVPASIYLALNSDGEAARGWGIPMSTDIAFSLGVLALLGTRAPLPLKVFLAAFAIVDDIGAIIVIAVFFTETINWQPLGIGFALIASLLAINFMGVRNVIPYFIISAAVWVSFFNSGVHPTIAGVLVSLTIPLRVRMDPEQFVARGRALLNIFEQDDSRRIRRGQLALTTGVQTRVLDELESATKQVESPLQQLEHALHPWVAFVIMPLFAFANAHVIIDSSLLAALTSPVTIGIVLGLVVGKPVGVILFAWLAVKAGVATLPRSVNWAQIVGAALLGGIGFTMSIFVTGLAFMSPELILQAKAGIMIASVIAGVGGYAIIRGSSN